MVKNAKSWPTFFCSWASICVVNKDNCCKGTREPLVLGPNPKSFKWRPWGPAVPSKRELNQAISKPIGCKVLRTKSFFNRNGVKFPMMDRLHLPSDHQVSLCSQISRVFRISSPNTSQVKSWFSWEPSWQTVHVHFHRPKQFSSRIIVVTTAKSHAESNRKVISKRSALMPDSNENLAESRAVRVMSTRTTTYGAMWWNQCNTSALMGSEVSAGRDWANA